MIIQNILKRNRALISTKPMHVVKKKYTHLINCKTEVDINNNQKFNLHIVYYINCLVNKNYFTWLANQINLVKNFDAPIYIVATISPSEEEVFKQRTFHLFPNNNITIECYYENEFEYRGILKAWELGQIHNSKNDIILYFHSKGVTRNPTYAKNANDNYNIILKDIHKIQEIFTIFPKIDKVGFCNNQLGWVWYNFWYARGSYINNVERPVRTLTNRYYYEHWLSKQLQENQVKFPEVERPISMYNSIYKLDASNCYNFYTNNNKLANISTYYDPPTNRWHSLN